jgi:tRNA(Arg) A34 adenosine deaminase TadA
MKAKLLANEEKETTTLLSKSYPLESQILLLTKSLKEAKNNQLRLKEFLVDGCTKSDPIILSPRPTRHPTTRTLQFTTLIVSLDPCPICKGYYVNHEFVVVSCNCVYHPWCITIHV